jgi:magnesium transporter
MSPATAAAHASSNVPTTSPEESAGSVLDRMRASARFDSAADVAVLEGGRLAGLIDLEELLAAPSTAPAASLMDAHPPLVMADMTEERAAWEAVRHGRSSLAVVDSSGRFVGLIAGHLMLDVMLRSHDQDLARLGGFLDDTAQARRASVEGMRQRFWHRLPWLLVGLAASVLAAVIVGRFERNLADDLLLFFFIPGVVYMADAVGTQTETLVVRGLAAGIPVRGIFRRELLTGLVIGLVIGVLAVPLAFLLWGRTDVALVVGISLWAACSTATAVAMLLPWALSRVGTDPAFGSGPLATVIQDLLSLMIYFAVASAIVM